MEVKLSQKGWVVIPAALREKYGLKPGDSLRVVDYGGVLSIVPLQEYPIREGAGLLTGPESLTEAVIAEHHQEREYDA